jgi:hypothetical protein
MKNLLIFILLINIQILVCGNSAYALEAMPYTKEAVKRLNDAIDRIGKPIDSGSDVKLRVKTYIETYRRIFASAGYDYERSIMKIINDIQFDKYPLNTATIKLDGLARDLLRLHVKTGVHPNTYLSRDCGELLLDFRDLIRSNMKKYGSC